jgi:hypothetical protein
MLFCWIGNAGTFRRDPCPMNLMRIFRVRLEGNTYVWNCVLGEVDVKLGREDSNASEEGCAPTDRCLCERSAQLRLCMKG